MICLFVYMVKLDSMPILDKKIENSFTKNEHKISDHGEEKERKVHDTEKKWESRIKKSLKQ